MRRLGAGDLEPLIAPKDDEDLSSDRLELFRQSLERGGVKQRPYEQQTGFLAFVSATRE